MKQVVLPLALALLFAFSALAATQGKTGKPDAATLATGKAVYDKSCASCHASGVMGAPKTGDKAAWKAHIALGSKHLDEVAIKGFGKMPPKGGNMALSDAEVRAAVVYMVEQSR